MHYNEYDYVQPRNSYRNPHDDWRGMHPCKFSSSKVLIHPRSYDIFSANSSNYFIYIM